MNIKHTEVFDLAYRFVTETNLNIFLTGKAGTGKTTFLKYLRQNTFKKMVVAAPTGVAAINAGGVTLHSLFQLPFAPFIPASPLTPLQRRGEQDIHESSTPLLNNRAKREGWERSSGAGGEATVNTHSLLSQIRYHKEKLNLLRNLELLVIDEASMVPSHTVDAIDTILRSIKRRQYLPFGGTQVLFIGDLHQLPPVVRNQEWEFLKNYYPSVFFFDSMVLRENVPVMIELKEIFRQRDNSFINVLNEIRHNTLTLENLSLLNSRLQPDFIPADDEGYITLTTHNAQSDELNKRQLKKLKAHSQIYHAEINGDYPEHLYPAEPRLELKEGAQVMFLKNDVEGKKYFNGKIGTITTLDADRISVQCTGEQYEIEVKKYEWKNMNYSLNPDTREIREEELGGFLQYPLRLAWAITIHKSQGLTFNKLIIDAENAFANGQVYVALSRCTSLEGLILTSPVNRKFLGAHQNLKDWQEKNQDEKNLQQKFNESRQKYIQQELQNIFTWKNWFYELRELNDAMIAKKENLPPVCFSWIKELVDKQKILDVVAEKFVVQIKNLCNNNLLSVEENQPLQKRIKEAANYFSAEIMKWKTDFANHSLSTDTKKVARKIDTSLNEINFIVHEILHKMDHCRNGFILDDYLKSGKKLTEIIEKAQSSYAQDRIRNVSSQELEHAALYDLIAGMRNRIGKKAKLPLYTIFSNNAIKNVCMRLPQSKDELLQVKGFGKVKVKKYGDEVVELVRNYCLENNHERVL